MPDSIARRAPLDSSALRIAAQSVLASRVLEGTVDEVASSSALDHSWSALFQYALIRVGSRRGAALLSQLGDSSARPCPGPDRRACPELYRALRQACLQTYTHVEPSRSESVDALQTLPMDERTSWFWEAPDPAYARCLAVLRSTLRGQSAEVAELHLVHGLDLSEVAYVMGITEQAVADSLEEALQAAASWYPPPQRAPSDDGSAEGVLREAFSLDPTLAPAPPRRRRAPVLPRGVVVAERYEIQRLLGAGAFADVYEACDRGVEGHSVALKMSRTVCKDVGSAQLALRELQLLASVFHPSVVQLKDHGWHEGHLWFVMPLYRGQTLSARLRQGPLSRAEAEALFVPLAEALATMHRAGVLHQDIKPDNIFLAEIDPDDGTGAEGGVRRAPTRILPVLLDLGVAARTAEVVLAGTPAYLAPEVAAHFAGLPDPAPVGPKADVFALALTLRDALKPDLGAGPPCTSIDAFVARRATQVQEVPQSRALRDLRGAFERWLALRPDDRPSADALCRELAILTAPQRRSARRAAALRWAVPTTVAVLAVFSSVVFWLSREAALQRAGAADALWAANQARERAAALYTDVRVQQARSRRLEADVSRLQGDIDQSQLSRAELTRRLELAESTLQMALERIGTQRRRLAEVTRSADTLSAERDELQQALRRAQAKIGARRKDATEQLEYRMRLEQRMAELELALEQARVQSEGVATAQPPRKPRSVSAQRMPTTGR
jgi:hypothetical protein